LADYFEAPYTLNEIALHEGDIIELSIQ